MIGFDIQSLKWWLAGCGVLDFDSVGRQEYYKLLMNFKPNCRGFTSEVRHSQNTLDLSVHTMRPA